MGFPAVHRLSEAELAADKSWWTLYRTSFPEAEREPPEIILSSLRSGPGAAFRAVEQGLTAGLATTHRLQRWPALFLVYLAVARGQQGQGWGGHLLQSVLSPAAGVRGAVWEVDRVDKAVPSGEQQRRERRVRFFARHGAVMLPTPYRQPPVDGRTVVPMQLMYLPLNEPAIPDRAETDRLIQAMYFEKYGMVNGIPETTLNGLLNTPG